MKNLILVLILLNIATNSYAVGFTEASKEIHTIVTRDANGKVIKTEKMTATQLNSQNANTKNHYYIDKSGKRIKIQEGLRTHTFYDSQGKYMGTYYK